MTNGANSQTADLLKNALRELKTTKKRIEELERKAHEPIAVVGMGCRFPGNADSPEKLWELLENGVDAIVDMKDERWVADDFYDPNPEAAGKLYTKAVGLVDSVDQFDPEFFNIAPVEAKLMEPQQRLLLEASWHALEHAGIAPRDLNGSKTGVFVGICHQGYAHMQARYCEIEAVSPYDGTGNAHAVASGRISYIMGLQGPSVSVDTACSSSLVSIHLAVQSLRSGESDLALAGGVNLILEPTTSMIFARAGMLAPDGRCKTFDADANGYVRAEGCGMVVLKRLSDAQRDGDRILAVVRGTAVNQDGTSQGITAPNELAQEKVIRAALDDARLNPLDVSYVEAHGTGTSLGDPIELSALNSVYGSKRDAENKLVVGSIKTNMGHAEGAAGVLGFMKLVLALQHRTIPAHLHFKKPNGYIDWNTLAIKIPTEKMAWNSNGPLTGGLSSFGFSGTNSHIIVQEAPASDANETLEGVAAEVKNTWLPLNLSAKNEKALDQLVNDYIGWMEKHPHAAWQDIAFTASTGRNHFRHRLSVLADSRENAINELKNLQAGQVSENVKSAEVRPSAAKLGFLFTGQGAQYAGMGQTLYDTHPIFRAALDECAQKLSAHMDKPLLSVLWGDNSAFINQTQYTQPAIFSLQYALTQYWASLGVTPSAVTGHSIGEYAAAVAAGVMTLDDAITLIAARGRLMAELCEPGAMLAVFADQAKVETILRDFGTQVSIAAINGPNNTVLAGGKAEIEQLQAVLSDEGIKFRALSVSHAFHSYLMEPMLDAFREVAQKITFKQPRISFISSKTGEAAG
ncbi:MAG TPA: type I polyketide synthase, partial [Pseudomonadales bacterium]|nr:type I polyketide synthase [Pseudomonadales bacterium]